MFGNETKLCWRERSEDFSIDIRRDEDGADWFTFDYKFTDREGDVSIYLSERVLDDLEEEEYGPCDLETDQDPWTSAFFTSMSYLRPNPSLLAIDSTASAD